MKKLIQLMIIAIIMGIVLLIIISCNILGGRSNKASRILNDLSNSLTLNSVIEKIYVIGKSSNGRNADMYVIRLNSDGSMDNSFGVNLGRDENKDGNNDSSVIVNSIATGNGCRCCKKNR